MCGIIGYTGYGQAQDVLLDGLARLEYRGYDSAGIAYFRDPDHVSIRKTAGKVADLRAVCDDVNWASCGIGHTRWATHGGVSTKNAHPHRYGRVTLIHNGIIENYDALKKEYGLSGSLKSQTDTEVAAAVLDKIYDGDPVRSLQNLTSILKGSYAFCVLFSDHPNEIYAIRNVSPLVAGSSNQGSFIASDLTAFIEYTNRYFIIPEYYVVKLTKRYITIYDPDGGRYEPKLLSVDWDTTAAQKEGYDYYMLKEIHEQPAAVTNTISPRIRDGLPDFTVDGIPDSLFENVTDITVVACGTAMHAGMVGKTLMTGLLHIPVTVQISSEFRYEDPVITGNTLVIAISQSGETVDTLEAVRLAKRYTDKVLAFVNVKGSTIARESAYVIYTHAGPEICVASTKAYAVQMAAVYLVAAKLALVSGRQPEPAIRAFMAELHAVPSAIEETLKMEDQIAHLTRRMINAKDAFFIGRGLDYTSSMEGALKLKEVSYIHAEAYAAGELKHGPIALVSDGVPVIALATQEHVYSKVMSNIKEVKARGAHVILLSKDKHIRDRSICDVHIPLPKMSEPFTSFTVAAVLQLIAYYAATGKGLDPDQPRNLAKSVTVE